MARRKYKARPNRSRFAREKGRRFTESDVFDLDAMAKETVRAKGGVEIPRYYFTMHYLDKVGIRPLPGYSRTPLGVYGYPLTEEYLQILREESLPYGQKAPNVTVLEITDPSNCLVLAVTESGHRNISLYREFYAETKDAVGGGEKDKRFTYKLTSLLRSAGYTSVYDSATGTVHKNEPHQVCFLEPSAFRVVQSIPQSLVKSPEIADTLSAFSAGRAFKKIAYGVGLKYRGLEIIKASFIELYYGRSFIVSFYERLGNDGKPSSIVVGLTVMNGLNDGYIKMLGVLNEFMMWARSAGIPLFWGHLGLQDGLRSSVFTGGIIWLRTMDYKDEKVLVGSNGEEQILIEHRDLKPAMPFSIPIFVSEDATDQVQRKLKEWLDAAPDMFSVSVVPVEVIRERVDVLEPPQAKNNTSSVAKPNRGRSVRARYMLRDLDDENFVLPFDASSDAEAMVEARRRVGNRTGNYCVTRTGER